jgi:serine/threonine protein phosphatase PrpC
LKQVVDDTNRSLLDMRREMGTDMGSTLVMAIMDGSKAYLAHVGDSRAYRINADGIEALTTDHSMVARLVASGVIKPEEVRSHPQRNIVYRTMGDKVALEIDVAEHTLQPGDRLLLCSDGLWEMVVEADLQKIVMEASSPQQACQKLVEVANAHGGVDNITVIIIEVELS